MTELKRTPNKPAAPRCARCRTTMTLVTVISDPKRDGRVYLFECGSCQITSLRPES